ncbi:hypothetical protein CYY_005520 [Polysphondylium violaceum]|uniref:Dyp-type peroxidase family protein n=1 Tax=Polysphondylium violaceum TaxID=133409 RepID=A0A8J4PTI2_9MYCE|nr:hypothetical protein CYY_005520 [Polysphondylium violaceum]
MASINAQTAILPMHCKYGIFLEASLVSKDLNQFRKQLLVFNNKVEQMRSSFAGAGLGASIAFGFDAWKKLSSNVPKELRPFVPIGNAPATQRDLFIHILSLEFDVAFALAQACLEEFHGHINIEEETHGFRRLEERDLTNFIDGTENPVGDKRVLFGLIPKGDPYEYGSYVLTQRYVHHLDKWTKVPIKEQEQVIGRTKEDSIEIPPEKRPITSHVGRTDLSEDGKDLKILRQSLPYGKASGEHGLYFLAYSTSLHNIDKQLKNMFGQIDGKTDLLLDFVTPVSGSYYFAPSLLELKKISNL